MCNFKGKYRQVDKASLVIFVFGIPIPSSAKAVSLDWIDEIGQQSQIVYRDRFYAHE